LLSGVRRFRRRLGFEVVAGIGAKPASLIQSSNADANLL
jgi:hypothetical protein